MRSEPAPAQFTPPSAEPALTTSRAALVLQPRIERGPHGIVVHLQLLDRSDPQRPRTAGWLSGPFATASVARHELERLLNMRKAVTPGALIEANGRTHDNVDDAMERLWPLSSG